MDIPPDVDFIGQQNGVLLNMALQMLRHAEDTVGRDELELRFAQFLDNGAEQALNTVPVAEARIAHAKAGLGVAMAGTDLAKGRIKNIDQKMSEIRSVLEDEFEADDSPFAVMTQIFEVGFAVGQIAVGVGTGVGALVEIGRGFPTLQKTVDGATGMFDLVKDVKKELNDGSLKKFKSSIKELAETGQKVYLDVGKLVSELDGIKSTHPDPRGSGSWPSSSAYVCSWSRSRRCTSRWRRRLSSGSTPPPPTRRPSTRTPPSAGTWPARSAARSRPTSTRSSRRSSRRCAN